MDLHIHLFHKISRLATLILLYPVLCALFPESEWHSDSQDSLPGVFVFQVARVGVKQITERYHTGDLSPAT